METVLQRLQDYQQENWHPFHMPGHKRNLASAPHLAPLGGALDITEIQGFDNLHEAEDILKRSMERAARLWGSEESHYLVNGSTGGLLAALRTLTRRGDTILVARNCHKSVFHGIELCGLRPVFLSPPLLEEWGICGGISAEQVAEGFKNHPEIRAVVLTSPTYEGILSDIAGICQVAHERGVPVLVDEAHGGHLGLHGIFPDGAVKCGADLVVQSLHKTLPSLTQTAILHAQGDLVDRLRLRHQLSVFQTSSPSYLFLASMDGCVRSLEHPELLRNWQKQIQKFREKMQGLRCLRLFAGETAWGYDGGKLLLSPQGGTGYALGEALRAEKIEPEFCTPNTVLLMTGTGEAEESLDYLAEVLLRLDSAFTGESTWSIRGYSAGETVLPIEQALEVDWTWCPVDEAEGRIAGEYVWAYPPGIPILLPGERISAEYLRPIVGQVLHSTSNRLPDFVAVLPMEKP